jgi:hypothetical protein
VGEDRGSKETDGCPLTDMVIVHQIKIGAIPSKTTLWMLFAKITEKFFDKTVLNVILLSRVT